MIGVVAVDELTRAYRAAVGGEFRTGRRAQQLHEGDTSWTPSLAEDVIVVVGCHGGSGASTVALGLASAAGEARVVECAPVASSGLAAASLTELGSTPEGWLQGSRGSVLIERRGERLAVPFGCPAPAPTTKPVTVLDCAADADLLAADGGWLGRCVRSAGAVVVVSRPTIPGLRRLEAALGLLAPQRVTAVLVGVEKRWPRHVGQALGPTSRVLRANGRVVGLPHDPTLAVQGLTPAPLPAPVLAGCSVLLALLKEGHR